MIKLLLSLFTYFPYSKFISNIDNVERAQNKVLNRILSESKKLSYYEHPIKNYEEFSQLQINEYDDFSKSVIKDVDGGLNNSVFGRVISTEKTSGTTSGSKVIPYTKRHLLNFLNLTSIWIYDLINSEKLGLRSLKTFISVSPAFSEKSGNLKNQIESDEEYLPLLLRVLFGHKLLLPKGIKGVRDPKEYNQKLSLHLLSLNELEIISIWNPTYLITYLNLIIKNYDQLKAQLKRDDLPEVLSYENLYLLWPNLKFVSCWGDSNSKADYQKLKKLFPNILFQKKGLLSTEFPMTLPLLKNNKGHYPFITGIFMELKNDEGIFRLHELEIGKEYTLILSAPGGFHRYNTHDIVKVIDFDGKCPLFEFVGRDNLTSDMVGEKLAEVFVKRCIEKVCPDSFSYLEAVSVEDRKFYQIVTNSTSFDKDKLEELLRENIHYQYARNIKQLDAIEINYIKDAEEEYYQNNVKRGKKLGDIKRQYLLGVKNG